MGWVTQQQCSPAFAKCRKKNAKKKEKGEITSHQKWLPKENQKSIKLCLILGIIMNLVFSFLLFRLNMLKNSQNNISHPFLVLVLQEEFWSCLLPGWYDWKKHYKLVQPTFITLSFWKISLTGRVPFFQKVYGGKKRKERQILCILAIKNYKRA